MLIALRALTYSALFIGLVLIYLPAQLVPGLHRPAEFAFLHWFGAAISGVGAAVAARRSSTRFIRAATRRGTRNPGSS